MARVLIVEDRPEIQALLEAVVARAGHQAQIAGDGVQARAKLEPKPDLIFLDLGLPGKSGIDLVQEIRALPGFETIPVVIVTAHPDGATQIKNAGLRRVELVSKPFRFEQLSEIIARHLGPISN